MYHTIQYDATHTIRYIDESPDEQLWFVLQDILYIIDREHRPTDYKGLLKVSDYASKGYVAAGKKPYWLINNMGIGMIIDRLRKKGGLDKEKQLNDFIIWWAENFPNLFIPGFAGHIQREYHRANPGRFERPILKQNRCNPITDIPVPSFPPKDMQELWMRTMRLDQPATDIPLILEKNEKISELTRELEDKREQLLNAHIKIKSLHEELSELYFTVAKMSERIATVQFNQSNKPYHD